MSDYDALRKAAEGALVDAQPCPICGVHFCALFATTNGAALADWRALHRNDDRGAEG